jgi:4-hydroxybenzoate polyprenyltransferase
MNQYFSTFQNILDTYEFHPDFIWNADETMISIGSDLSKVIVFTDQPPPCRIKPSKLEHMTLMLAGCPSGYSMKPLVILPLKRMPELSFPVQIRYNFYVGNPTGWQNEESLHFWINSYFIPQIQEMREIHKIHRPALLILDGHSSRNNINLEKLWLEHQIAISLIPPNTSHILQPLDLSVNSMLKMELGKKYKYIPNQTAQQRREHILSCAIRPLTKALCEDTVITGWERSGLYPLNPIRFRTSTYVKTTPNATSNQERKRPPAPIVTNPMNANNWPKIQRV